jgi:hypothetical protein
MEWTVPMILATNAFVHDSDDILCETKYSATVTRLVMRLAVVRMGPTRYAMTEWTLQMIVAHWGERSESF